jgi:hypothetical protein
MAKVVGELVKMSDKAPEIMECKDISGIVAIKRGADHPFSSGSVGYYGNGRTVIAGQSYQVSLTLTLIGSKPESVK